MNTNKKNISLEEFKKNSFVISIDRKRFSLFSKIFKKSLNFVPNLLLGETKFDTYAKNCKQSHTNIIKLAKEKDLPFVVIFEDDAYPCKNLEEKLKDILSKIPEDSEVFMLGFIGLALDENFKFQKFDKDINKVEACIYGCQSYIVFKNGYDRIIQLLESTDKPIDNVITNGGFLKNIGITSGYYSVRYPLFIQFNFEKSFSKLFGFTFPSKETFTSLGRYQPPENFYDIHYFL